MRASRRRWLSVALLGAAHACIPTDVGNPFDEPDAAADAGAAGDGTADVAVERDAAANAETDSAETDATPDGAPEDAATDGGDAPVGDSPDMVDTEGDDRGPDALVLEPWMLVPAFDVAAQATDFYATPWPSDARLTPDGAPDLTPFPLSAAGIVRTFRDTVHGAVRGFSTMPVLYVRFAGDIGAVQLPDPAATLREDAPVQLIALDEAGCGARVPIRVQVDTEGDAYVPRGTLMATPVPGFALRARTAYAFVVRDTLGAAEGLVVTPPSGAGDALHSRTVSAWSSSLEPLRVCAGAGGITLDGIALATVFTTQDAHSELQALRDFVADPAQVPAPALEDLVLSEELSSASRRTWLGTYATPIFQRGDTPYVTGGAFAFDASGRPVVQRWERVPFTISLPATGEGPFPILVFSDGTYATLRETLRQRPVSAAIASGLAVATFAAQFHDVRSVPGSDPVLHGFNFINPTAGRTVFRQQALDTTYFVRVLREAMTDQGLEAAGAPGLAGQLDASALVYGGHSQGGLVGALVAGVETEFLGYVLNGTGSYLSHTIVTRIDPVDIAELIRDLLALRRPLDVFHPVVQLAQLATDVVEPHVYAWAYAGRPGNEAGAHMLVINGLLDTTTFAPNMNAMAISGGLSPIAPPGWDVDPYGVWSGAELPRPIQGNGRSLDDRPLTLVTYLDAARGHHTLHDSEDARALAIAFWHEARTGVPVIAARAGEAP